MIIFESANEWIKLQKGKMKLQNGKNKLQKEEGDFTRWEEITKFSGMIFILYLHLSTINFLNWSYMSSQTLRQFGFDSI